MEKKYRVLLVPDYLFWVTGTIAQAIAAHPQVQATICSHFVLDELLKKCNGLIPFPIDVVHFLTPHIATHHFKKLSNQAACVATIHHVEDSKSIEPVSYIDSIATVCDQWHKYLIKGICDPSRVVQIKNGLDTNLFRPATGQAEKDRLRLRYGIPKKTFAVGFSAKRTSDSSNRKGLGVLESLMEMSAQKNDKITWVIRGPGWQSFVDRLRARGLSIVYLPFLYSQFEVAESYRALDSFLVTSQIEGGPYPLIEAMSSGVPSISTPVGLALEVVDDSNTAFMVPFGDTSAFYDRLCQIRSDPLLQRKLSRKGSAAICEKMSWSKNLDPLPKLYNIALDNSKKRAIQNHSSEVFSTDLSYIKKWIKTREYAIFSEFLWSENYATGAKHFANMSILTDPFDFENVIRCIHKSSLSFPYKVVRKIKKYFHNRLIK